MGVQAIQGARRRWRGGSRKQGRTQLGADTSQGRQRWRLCLKRGRRTAIKVAVQTAMML